MWWGGAGWGKSKHLFQKEIQSACDRMQGPDKGDGPLECAVLSGPEMPLAAHRAGQGQRVSSCMGWALLTSLGSFHQSDSDAPFLSRRKTQINWEVWCLLGPQLQIYYLSKQDRNLNTWKCTEAWWLLPAANALTAAPHFQFPKLT